MKFAYDYKVFMNVGDFVIVINKEKNLYRRRCKVVSIDECSNGTRCLVYSEGLEEEELLVKSDFKESDF